MAISIMAVSTAFSQIEFGIGTTAGTKLKLNDKGETQMNIGINGRGLFELSDQFFLSGGYTFFLTYSFDNNIGNYTIEHNYNYALINADLNYYFLDEIDFLIYGMGGLNYGMTRIKIKQSGLPDIKDTEGHFDFELGAGIRIESLFGEIKYNNAHENLLFTIGVYL